MRNKICRPIVVNKSRPHECVYGELIKLISIKPYLGMNQNSPKEFGRHNKINGDIRETTYDKTNLGHQPKRKSSPSGVPICNSIVK